MALRIEAFGVEIDIADMPPILGDFQRVEDSLVILEPFLQRSAQALLGTKVDSDDEKLKKWKSENGKLLWSLFQMVTQNTLSGVFNREFLIAKMEKMLPVLKDDPMNTLGLIMIDIDNFKIFNDRHGHDQGDKVLRGMGQLLLRYNDSFNVISRFGGEEYVLALPSRTDENHIFYFHNTILSVAPYIRAELARMIGYNEPITVSVGGYLCGPSDTADSALRKVDDAMYLAKGYGRDRTVILDSNGSGADHFWRKSPKGRLYQEYLKPAEFYSTLNAMRATKQTQVRSGRTQQVGGRLNAG